MPYLFTFEPTVCSGSRRCCRAEHEYFTFNGLSLRRKRTRPSEENEIATLASAHVPEQREYQTSHGDVNPSSAASPTDPQAWDGDKIREASAAVARDDRFTDLSQQDRVVKMCTLACHHIWEQGFAGHGNEGSMRAFQEVMYEMQGAVAQSLSNGSVRVSSQNSGAVPLSQSLRIPTLRERKLALTRHVTRLEEERDSWRSLENSISNANHACVGENVPLNVQDSETIPDGRPLEYLGMVGIPEDDAEAEQQIAETPDTALTSQIQTSKSLRKALMQVRFSNSDFV